MFQQEQARNQQFVDARLFEGKLSSKDDWYRFLKYHQGYCLPGYKNTSMRFIKDFLQGSKFLIKQKELVIIEVPHYPEFKIENILKQIKNDVNIIRHLNYYSDSKVLPERDFFFKIVGTLAPDYLQQLVKSQNRLRNIEEVDYNQQQAIAIRNDIFEAIQEEPFFSRSKGKALGLLKVQSKARRQMTKKRKVYDLQQNYKDQEEEKMAIQPSQMSEQDQAEENKRFKFNL